MKIHIATSRDIGRQCLYWAEENMPEGAVLVADPEQSDVFISVMYGHLVSEEFIAKRRCYNFHPGVLPGYRGAGAFSWAIINGEKRCGVTLHILDVDIDTGALLECQQFYIEAWDTAETLYAKGVKAMFEMFQRWWPKLIDGSRDADAVPQDQSKSHTYYRKDLEKARDLTRFVRAFTFEGKEPAFYTDHEGNKMEVRW